MLVCSETLFIMGDFVAYEGFDKKRQPLLDLAILVRHWRQYVWLLTQSYFAIPKNLRRLAKTIFISYSKESADLKTIQAENDVLTNDELVIVRDLLKESNIHVYTYGVNILVDFVLKKMTEKKSNNTRKTSETCCKRP